MKKQINYFFLGFLIIFLSTPLARITIRIWYANRNLAGEYEPILNGFIHSFMLIGALIFSIGLVNLLKDKN
jgi:hypothetical protein